MIQTRRNLGSSWLSLLLPVLLALVVLPSRIYGYDFLYVVGKNATTNGMHLSRIADAGTGATTDMGQIRIADYNNYVAFTISGAAFDYRKVLRPLGDLFILTDDQSGPASNKVLRIPDPIGLSPNARFIDAFLYADAAEYSVGLAISDQARIFTWRIGENKAFPEDDLMRLIAKDASSLFPQPAQTNLNSGIFTTDQLVGYDFRRDRNGDELLHMIYFDKNTNRHSYFVFNLRTAEGEWRSTEVTLDERNDRCYLGSMNPNNAGEFWCIVKSIDRASQQEIIRIDLNASPPKQVAQATLPIASVAAIAFSYDTTMAPSRTPSRVPSRWPSARPSRTPSRKPSKSPSRTPSRKPSRSPSRRPSSRPSHIPSEIPSRKPSRKPSRRPSQTPTRKPSRRPSQFPSERPSRRPNIAPSRRPSQSPTRKPSRRPSHRPTGLKSARPSTTTRPSARPSRIPSEVPSRRPSRKPSRRPSGNPTSRPSRAPSRRPSARPSSRPSRRPSRQPSRRPSHRPSTLNRCNVNNCSYLGFLPGSQVFTIAFGVCINRCVPFILEGVYDFLGWTCGTC